MRRSVWQVCLAASLSGGCVLAWQPLDTTAAKAEKLIARIPLAVVTLGISEVVIDRETAREEQWKAEARRDERKAELRCEMDFWKRTAFETKDDKQRQTAMTLFEAAREDLRALEEAPVPPLRDRTAQAEPGGAK